MVIDVEFVVAKALLASNIPRKYASKSQTIQTARCLQINYASCGVMPALATFFLQRKPQDPLTLYLFFIEYKSIVAHH